MAIVRFPVVLYLSRCLLLAILTSVVHFLATYFLFWLCTCCSIFFWLLICCSGCGVSLCLNAAVYGQLLGFHCSNSIPPPLFRFLLFCSSLLASCSDSCRSLSCCLLLVLDLYMLFNLLLTA
ncbi:hypothetical protein FPV67DRAFT_1540692 [Lyophyllum atratum]|nr:hypothetical protein FPV67DRAFT_1540692 [Lyophyllum atratum]